MIPRRHPASKALIAGHAALALAACASTPDAPPPPPRAPEPAVYEEPPVPPMGPIAPRAPALEAPRAPEGRRQTWQEAYQELFVLGATPEVLPLEPGASVAVACPQGVGAEERTAVLGALLRAGYEVKDAGAVDESEFRVEDDAIDREGFERVRDAEAALVEGSEIVRYLGLDGMRLALQDPTSLWIPDLAANPNLAVDAVLRVFTLDFEDEGVELSLGLVVDPGELERYRTGVEQVNARAARYNRELEDYVAALDRYRGQYRQYVAGHESWERDQVARYEASHELYQVSFRNWRKDNSDVIEAAFGRGEGDSAWRGPRRPAMTDLPAVQPERDLPDPEPIELLSTDPVEAELEGREPAMVPSRSMTLIAQLVDARSGEVRWVGSARARVPDSWTLQDLVAEVVRRLVHGG